MTLSADPQERLARARTSLEGLSFADALGGFFEFNHRVLQTYVAEKRLPAGVWRYTDDTNMALSIYAVLREYGEINQDALAASFAEHFNPLRGYGAGARRLVSRIREGEDWRTVSKAMFSGTGSYGNGGAMRVAPLGAYFADDLSQVVQQVTLSAEITHAHPEGIAGAIAAAVAAALAHQLRASNERPSRQAFIDRVLPHVPESEVRSRIVRARDVADATSVLNAAEMLGNGSGVSAQTTVPFTLYIAGEFLDDYERAFWQTASAGGDVDTTCAIACGIVSGYTGTDAIPGEWLTHREDLPGWAFGTD